MTVKPYKELFADLKRDEGFESKPYRDTEGKLTIGYGTLIEDGITEEEAELLLEHRMNRFQEELRNAMPMSRLDWADMPGSVRRAVYNMAYNMGVPRLLRFTKMWAALKEEDFETAACEVLDSEYGRKLTARANRVADMIRSGAR